MPSDPGKPNMSPTKFNTYLIVLVIVQLSISCNQAINDTQEIKRPLFNQLTSEETGITFSNNLKENDIINYFTYPYLYMGGGVSIGDINNDGLQDIYFTGNMVKNKLYLNKGNLEFEDISQSAGVEADSRWITGTTMADVNGDGYLDIYVSVAGRFPPKENLLFINNGDLTFTESAVKYNVADAGNSTQATFFDYDRDGDLDLYVANYPVTKFDTPPNIYRFLIDNVSQENTDRFYENDAGKGFSEVTERAGLMSFGLSLSVTAGDFDQDGWPDLYVSNDFNSPDYFYFNNGDGTFRESSQKVLKHTALYGMGADAADFNNDGLLDLMQLDMTPEDNRRSKKNMASMDPASFWETVDYGMHHQYMQNCLQINNGQINSQDLSFSDISRIAGISSTDWSWAALFADLDNDGWKDIFVTNGTRRDINNKDYFKALKNKRFDEIRENMVELTKDIPSEAIDNYVFKNNGDLTFSNVIQQWGLSFVGFSNGVAYADLDNDGDLEIVLSNIDSTSLIYENLSNSIQNNRFLRFKLQGPPGNAFGIGTKVHIYYQGNQQFQELTLTRGFQSSVEPIVHFGLGSIDKIDQVIISWPDGKHKVLNDIAADQLVTVAYSTLEEPVTLPKTPTGTLFTEITQDLNLHHEHLENRFDDYRYEPLLPHKTSHFGPGLSVGDVNNDQREDFFIGGASQSSGMMYLQAEDGTFYASTLNPWSNDSVQEDLGSLLFDADGDGDLDLYVVSGGNEFEKNTEPLQDRLYINDGQGGFVKARNSLPKMLASGSCARAADYDYDGDLDLFVGGRLVPRSYPLPARSYILENVSQDGKIKFEDVTEKIAPDLVQPGLVTDARWVDFDNDDLIDLVVVGEWMPLSFFKNQNGTFENMTEAYGLEKSTGWWFSIEADDFDGDGDTDFIAGNLGLNYKYIASEEESFDIYSSDYDDNGSLDIVLGYYYDGTQYPVRGRQCSSEQIPVIEFKFKDYNSFAEATLQDVYTAQGLEASLHYQAWNFSSSYIENQGNGSFIIKSLPNPAQLSSINGVLSEDFDQDGNLDIVIAGNLFVSEVETPRNDAGIGLYLQGDGHGNFKPVRSLESGFYAPYDAKALATINTAQGKVILVANNDEVLQAFRINPQNPLKILVANK